MPSLAIVVHKAALAVVHRYSEDIALNGVSLVGSYHDFVALCVESEHLHNLPFAACELLHVQRNGVACHAAAVLAESAEIKVLISVLTCLHYELGVVPRKEQDGVLRLHVTLVSLAIKLGCLLACLGAIACEAAVVLVAVHLKHIDALAVWAPSYVGEVAVCRVTSLEINCLTGLHVEHADSNLV